MALPLLNKREHGKTTKVEQRREKTERKREREWKKWKLCKLHDSKVHNASLLLDLLPNQGCKDKVSL